MVVVYNHEDPVLTAPSYRLDDVNRTDGAAVVFTPCYRIDHVVRAVMCTKARQYREHVAVAGRAEVEAAVVVRI
jgi:hypothetical protein